MSIRIMDSSSQPICSVEKTISHFDRNDATHREVEKSIKKKISRLAFGSLEMTIYGVFYKAQSTINNQSSIINYEHVS